VGFAGVIGAAGAALVVRHPELAEIELLDVFGLKGWGAVAWSEEHEEPGDLTRHPDAAEMAVQLALRRRGVEPMRVVVMPQM
jgi:hypothetical protein